MLSRCFIHKSTSCQSVKTGKNGLPFWSKQFKNLKIVVDSNNYKEKREKSLRDLARKKGRAVLATGSAIKLNPMSARERKIIHEEISFMKGLKTESVGEEPKRYLVIKKIDEKF